MDTTGGSTLTVHCADEGTVRPVLAPDALSAPSAGEAHIWFSTTEALRHRASRLGELLDPVEMDRAARFRADTDRERFVLGHGWLRELLGRYLRRDGSLIRMARGPYGKPYLEGKELRFNFSDTKDAFAIAFTSGMEIGVDIETTSRRVDHDAVSGHYFTPAEIRAIRSGATDQKRRFLEFWTRKEAVLKASGVGIMEDLRNLRVDDARNEMTIAHEAFITMAAPVYHVRTWSIGQEHLLSLASPTPFRVVGFWTSAPRAQSPASP